MSRKHFPNNAFDITDIAIANKIRSIRCSVYKPPIKISLEHTKAIIATEINIVHLLRLKGSLKANSSKTGGTIRRNHRGSIDLSEIICGRSTPNNTTKVAVMSLQKKGIIKQRKADKDITLILYS